MAPRLQAEESQRAALQTAVGAGYWEDPQAKHAILERWERTAKGEGESVTTNGTPVREPEGVDALRAHGFAVRMIPKQRTTDQPQPVT